MCEMEKIYLDRILSRLGEDLLAWKHFPRETNATTCQLRVVSLSSAAAMCRLRCLHFAAMVEGYMMNDCGRACGINTCLPPGQSLSLVAMWHEVNPG